MKKFILVCALLSSISAFATEATITVSGSIQALPATATSPARTTCIYNKGVFDIRDAAEFPRFTVLQERYAGRPQSWKPVADFFIIADAANRTYQVVATPTNEYVIEGQCVDIQVKLIY